MRWFIVLAVFAAVVLLGLVAFLAIRRKACRLSRELFGTANFVSGLHAAQRQVEETPRSLSGCDRIYLPQICRDFPDFNVEQAKLYACEALQKYLAGYEGVVVHNVVISRYRRYGVEKTITFQAAAEHLEDGVKKQEKYELLYAYRPAAKEGETVKAASCPHCGAPLSSLEERVCTYCRSRLVDLLDSAWSFTDIRIC